MQFSLFFFKKLALTCINANYNIFIISQNLKKLVLIIFDDEIKIIALKNLGIIIKVKIKRITVFKKEDIRLINFYLNLKVNRNCQKKIIKLS